MLIGIIRRMPQLGLVTIVTGRGGGLQNGRGGGRGKPFSNAEGGGGGVQQILG